MFRGSVVLRSADATVAQFCFDYAFLLPRFGRPHERPHRLVNGCVGVRRADGWLTRVEVHIDEQVEAVGVPQLAPDEHSKEDWVTEITY
jgi:hypothetical protein